VGPDALLAPPGREDFDLLSGSGGHVWRLLEAPMTIRDLVEALSGAYKAPPEGIAEELEPFVRGLVDRGVLVETDADQG
jgi:hypothetical protein